MKALRFIEGRLALEEVSVPESVSECLVRVTKSGICNTDLEIVRGYAGFSGTIGHEFVGIVEKCDEGSGLLGKRVVGEINAGCGSCERCESGDHRHCSGRTVLGIVGRDGAHAEYLSLPAANLLEVPVGVSDDDAIFTEPLAAALGIGERVRIDRASKVAVVGDGKLGILCAWALRLLSSDVLLIGKHSAKLEIAAKGGVETMLLGGSEGLARSFDVVVEASGAESGFATALDLVRPRGSIVLKSTFHGSPTWEASRIVVDEISVVGSRCGRLAEALEVLSARRLPVGELIAARFPLAAAIEAVGHAGRRGVLKVILEM